MKKLKELGMDDEFGMYYDAEIVHRKEVNSAIAKNLLKMNLSVKDIMKATGLSKKQISMLS